MPNQKSIKPESKGVAEALRLLEEADRLLEDVSESLNIHGVSRAPAEDCDDVARREPHTSDPIARVRY